MPSTNQLLRVRVDANGAIANTLAALREDGACIVEGLFDDSARALVAGRLDEALGRLETTLQNAPTEPGA